MPNELMPLYYAILKQFMDGKEYCADDVIEALAPNYGSYKLLTHDDVGEALRGVVRDVAELVRCAADASGCILGYADVPSGAVKQDARYGGTREADALGDIGKPDAGGGAARCGGGGHGGIGGHGARSIPESAEQYDGRRIVPVADPDGVDVGDVVAASSGEEVEVVEEEVHFVGLRELLVADVVLVAPVAGFGRGGPEDRFGPGCRVDPRVGDGEGVEKEARCRAVVDHAVAKIPVHADPHVGESP